MTEAYKQTRCNLNKYIFCVCLEGLVNSKYACCFLPDHITVQSQTACLSYVSSASCFTQFVEYHAGLRCINFCDCQYEFDIKIGSQITLEDFIGKTVY